MFRKWLDKIWSDSKARKKCTQCGKTGIVNRLTITCKCGNVWGSYDDYNSRMNIAKNLNMKGRDLIGN